MYPTFYILLVHNDHTARRITGVYRCGPGGFNLNFHSVGSVEEALIRLRERKWALILFDTEQPDHSGMEGFTILREASNRCPLLIYASRNDEETALKALYQGAVDYIIKEAVTTDTLRIRIIKIVEQLAPGTAVNGGMNGSHTSPALFRRLITNLPDGVMLIGSDHIVRYVNPATCLLLDKTADELVGGQFITSLRTGETVRIELQVHNRVKTVEVRSILTEWKREQVSLLILRELVNDGSSGNGRAAINIDQEQFVARSRGLTGLIPVCAWCKKVRDNGNEWIAIELFVTRHSSADFTHCLCPDCAKQVRQNIANNTGQNRGNNAE